MTPPVPKNVLVTIARSKQLRGMIIEVRQNNAYLTGSIKIMINEYILKKMNNHNGRISKLSNTKREFE